MNHIYCPETCLIFYLTADFLLFSEMTSRPGSGREEQVKNVIYVYTLKRTTSPSSTRLYPFCIPQLGSSPAIVASGTSTTTLGESMSPVVVLHRSLVLDALNDARNFQEIEKKMEEIHSWFHFIKLLLVPIWSCTFEILFSMPKRSSSTRLYPFIWVARGSI